MAVSDFYPNKVNSEVNWLKICKGVVVMKLLNLKITKNCSIVDGNDRIIFVDAIWELIKEMCKSTKIFKTYVT